MKKIILTTVFALFCISGFSQEVEFNPQDLEIDIVSVHEEQLSVISESIERISAQVSEVKDIESLDETSVQSIKNDMNAIEAFVTTLKSQLTNYKNASNIEIDNQLNSIKELFQNLLSQLNEQKVLLKDLEESEADEIAQKLISNITNTITRIEDLTKRLEVARNSIVEKDKSITELTEENKMLSDTLNELRVELARKNGELYYFTRSTFRLGLAFGFNFNSLEYQYIVNNDSTVNESEINGPSGIASAVMIIQPDSLFGKINRLQLILNVPLVEVGLGGDNSTVSSIFNRQVSLGIGLGYQIPNSNVSIAGIINLRRVERIDENSFRIRNDEKLFVQEPFSKLDLEEFATTNEPNTTFTLGVVLKFGQ